MDITRSQFSLVEILGCLMRAKSVEILVDRLEDRKDARFIPLADSVPVSAIQFNETSANISITAVRQGHVDLSGLTAKPRIPMMFPAHTIRSKSIVRNGELLINEIPVRMPDDAKAVLWAMNVPVEPIADLPGAYNIKVNGLPFVGPNVKSPSSQEFAQKHFALLQVKAACKVFGHYASNPKQQSFEHVYGKDGAETLASLGITANGYSPRNKRDRKPQGLTLGCKFEGVADFPPVEEAIATIEKWQEKLSKRATGTNAKKNSTKQPKLPLCVSLMHPWINQIQSYKLSPLEPLVVGDISEEAVAEARKALFTTWARLQYESADRERRRLLREIGQDVFVLLSRSVEVDCDAKTRKEIQFSDTYVGEHGGLLKCGVNSDLGELTAILTLRDKGAKKA